MCGQKPKGTSRHAALVPLDPPAIIFSVISTSPLNPPGPVGPPLTAPDNPVTPNVTSAEAIPEGSVTRPWSENVSDPLIKLCTSPPATAEAEKSPVIQLPDAEAVPLAEAAKGGTGGGGRPAHVIGPMLASANPLPPKEPPGLAPQLGVNNGKVTPALAEKTPACAKGTASRKQQTHNPAQPTCPLVAVPRIQEQLSIVLITLIPLPTSNTL